MTLTTFSKPAIIALTVLICAGLLIYWLVLKDSSDKSTSTLEQSVSSDDSSLKKNVNKNNSELAVNLPAIQHIVKDQNSKPSVSEDFVGTAREDSTSDVDQFPTLPKVDGQIVPGLDLTEEQWVELRDRGLESERYLLVDEENSQSSPESEAYIQEWKRKVESDVDYLNNVEEDARRLQNQLSGESPTFEGQENMRLRGEEAERLLTPNLEN